jgi:putative membrane protein
MFVSGIGVLCIAWLGPWPELARTAFVPHMAVHVAVVAVAAPLLSAGLTGSRLTSRYVPMLMLAPVPASLIEFVVIWGWHFPSLHHLARASTAAFVAEQASFLMAGVLLWSSALRRGAGAARAAGVAGLLLTSMHMILLGTLLALANRPLYHHAEASGGEALLTDQQLGGMLMLVGGGVPYLAGALYLVWQLLQAPPPVAGTGFDTPRGTSR